MFHAEHKADTWMDRRKVKRTIESIKPSHGAHENSFDAVANMKKKTDTKDIYYIYQIGNINYGNTVDHVFKSSHKMAEIALQMDVNGEDNILQLENAYFDATHSCVQYFKSLGMWLVHPVMKKVLCLASMEIHSEHHKDIALFLQLFNKILEEVSGNDGYKFNPRYFVCDEAGTNYKVITPVYSEEFAAQCIKGCQWHFKSDVQKHLKHVQPEDQDLFLEICFKMCDVTTVADYNRLKGILDDIFEESPKIKPFILYWDPRHSHVFQPFRGTGLPGVNMSEQANKSFKPTSSKAMHLVNAAKYDVATMMYQEREIHMFEWSLLKAPGHSLSAAAGIAKDHAEQMKVAEDFGKIFNNEEDVIIEAEEANNPSMYIPKTLSSHGAPKIRQKYKRGGSVGLSNRDRGHGNGGRGRGICGCRRGGSKFAERKEDTRKGDKEQSEEVNPDDLLEEKLILAMEVTGSELRTERKNKVDNPPVIIITSWRITQCKGCRKGILKEEKAYPHNLVIHHHGIYAYCNPKTKQWVNEEVNVHFHLDMKCLQKNDPSLEKRHFVCNDEDFVKLDHTQMEVLMMEGS